MSALEDVVAAWTVAPAERRERALRVLKGELPVNQPLITRRALAKEIGYSVNSLRRWRVPGHLVGGARRFRVGEVLAYLATDEFQSRLAALRAERKQEGQE